MEINVCPKCNSRLWGVERYSAPKKLIIRFVVIVNIQKLKIGFIIIQSKIKKMTYTNNNDIFPYGVYPTNLTKLVQIATENPDTKEKKLLQCMK